MIQMSIGIYVIINISLNLYLLPQTFSSFLFLDRVHREQRVSGERKTNRPTSQLNKLTEVSQVIFKISFSIN